MSWLLKKNVKILVTLSPVAKNLSINCPFQGFSTVLIISQVFSTSHPKESNHLHQDCTIIFPLNMFHQKWENNAMAFFVELEHFFFQFVWEHPKQLNQSWERKMDLEDTPPDFRLYYKARVIKTVQYWHKNRKICGMRQKTQR